jgi:hypothetical protein
VSGRIRNVVGWARAVTGHRTSGRGRLVWRRVGVVVAMIAVTLVGTGVALRVDGHVRQEIGPFTATLQLRPALSGGTDIEIPPLGSLQVATHHGPAQLQVTLDSLDQERAKRFLQDPQSVQQASDSALPQVEHGVALLLVQSAAVAVLGSMVLAALVFRRMDRVAMCGGLALVTVLGSGAIALSSFRPRAIEEPRYEGLLANAPAVVGDAHNIANQFDAYRAELQGLVTNVSRLYAAVSTLPVYEPSPDTIRVLHISDLHLNPAAWSVIRTTVTQFRIDLVIDTGDINDWGTPIEASYVDAIGTLGVPYVFIRGNHDSLYTARAVAKQRNAIVLENQVTVVKGLTIGGIGDPRFTPDKTVENEPTPDTADPVYQSGVTLANTIRSYGQPVDIALVHDPASAGGLSGAVPLVLAGHLHHRDEFYLAPVQGQQKTLVLVEGSTGGAGLRGLQGEQPTPLEMSVLYFDGATHQLKAYDQITLGGTGQSQVTLERHLAPNGNLPTAAPNPSGFPAPSPSPS